MPEPGAEPAFNFEKAERAFTQAPTPDAGPDRGVELPRDEAMALGHQITDDIVTLLAGNEDRATHLGARHDRLASNVIAVEKGEAEDAFRENHLTEFDSVTVEMGTMLNGNRIVRLSATRRDESERVFEVEPDGRPTAGTITSDAIPLEKERITAYDGMFARDILAVLTARLGPHTR